MDQIAILILTVPVMLPHIRELAFDSVWFGVLVIVIAFLAAFPAITLWLPSILQ